MNERMSLTVLGGECHDKYIMFRAIATKLYITFSIKR